MTPPARIKFLSVGLALAVACEARGGEEAALSSFEHDPRVRVSLFAAEPQVVDPVALCFAADGTCYVLEMRDYPFGMGAEQRSGGVVRRLRDRDGDGRADESVVFAENLSFPTSITPWRGGVLVAAPPAIIYLEDADGDGTAEVRRVVEQGFPRGVTDSNFNGLRLGLDGLIHGVNGGNSGRITTPLRPGASAVTLGRLDFAFDPDTGVLTTTAETGGGFGLVFDEWGRSFTAHNVDYLQQRAISQRYLEGIPASSWLGPFTTFIAKEGHETRLFPIGQMETRVNHPEQAGHFSSGSGTFLFGQSAFGAEWENSVLSCDQAASLVHRDTLVDDGAVAVAVAANGDGKEFLASRDTGFRPTALEHGPDGAIYLADMQRDVIEHPDYIPAAVRQKLDLRAGEDRGRIYRLTPVAGLPAAEPSLAGASPAQLVSALSSVHPWRRVTAHRLLLEQRPAEAWPLLEKLAADEGHPAARVRALWLMETAGRLGASPLLLALDSAGPGVRENALRLAEGHATPELAAAVLEALRDPSPRVQFQAALTLGRLGGAERVEPLTALLAGTTDEWLRKASLIGIGPDASAALAFFLKNETWRAAGAAAEPLARLASSYHQPLPFPDGLAVTPAVVTGLAAGVGRAEGPEAGRWRARLEKWAISLPEEARPALFDLAGALGVPAPAVLAAELEKARVRAGDSTRPEAERAKAIALLGRGTSTEPLLALLSDHTSAGVQQAALMVLTRFREPSLGVELLARWRALNPAVRPIAIAFLVDHRPYHEAMVTALEKGEVTFGELNLDLEQRRRIIKSGVPDLRRRALKFFDDHEYSNRRQAVDDLLAQLPGHGDAKAGFRLYMERCQMCHARGKIGYRVGPDLLGLNHRSTEDLLSNIVDPNMAIHPNYVVCTVVTKNGDRHTGLLRDESADSVSVLMPLGSLVTVPRAEVESVTTLNRTLMPEGLEAGLLPAEIKGLIEYLQGQE